MRAHRFLAALVAMVIVSACAKSQSPLSPSVGDRTARAGSLGLLVPAGTIHSHWNPSSTDHLRFLEFIVAEKDKGRSIPQPMNK